jgi:hypothetical protein
MLRRDFAACRSVRDPFAANNQENRMSQDYSVTLDIRNSAQTEPGWINVAASNGSIYGYRYGGGSDGTGNVTEQGRGNADITINLIADASYYKMEDVAFSNDPENQLSRKSIQDLQVVVNDKNDKVESNAYYSITVKDKVANCTLVCDPRVSNTN